MLGWIERRVDYDCCVAVSGLLPQVARDRNTEGLSLWVEYDPHLGPVGIGVCTLRTTAASPLESWTSAPGG